MNTPAHNGPCTRRPALRSARAMGARTLYLMPNDRLQVSSTGEALVITPPEGPVIRCPAARIARVVCNPRVHWSGGALSLCQMFGIVVCWLDSHGRPQGHLWPHQASNCEPAPLLEALAAQDDDWPQAYENWLRQQRMRVLRAWQAARLVAGHPVEPEEWSRAKQAWVYRNELAEHLPAQVQGYVGALVAGRLADGGLQPHYWCADGRRLALAADLTHLIWSELNMTGGAIAEAMQQPRETAALFEQWSVRGADIVSQYLARLKALAMREWGA